MIISSKLTNKKYQWIRVPRTATMAYSKLFFPETHTNITRVHSHRIYNEFDTCLECSQYEKMNLDAFTLVRNPLDRFISSIYFITQRKNLIGAPDKVARFCEICGNATIIETSDVNSPHDFFEFYSNEKIFYEFFYDNFKKNCELKPGLDIATVFKLSNTSLIVGFFHTQIHWAYHPKIKIFKYEEIHKFNEWIETELGYDTSKLIHTNASRKKELKNIINVDFTTDKFKKLVKHLFYDDFRYFDYEFPI